MAITAETEGYFFLNSQSQFDSKVLSSLLKEGSIYYVGNRLYLALSDNTFKQMSELRLVDTLPAANASTVEKGLIYYAADTQLLAVAVEVEVTEPVPGTETEWVYLNNGYVSMRMDGNDVYLVRPDGTEDYFTIPTVTVGAGTNNELITADAAGVLKRGGHTIADVKFDVMQGIAEMVGPTLQELQDSIILKLPPTSGTLGDDAVWENENEITLTDDEGGVKSSGKKFVTTIAQTAGQYSDDEIPTEKAVMTAVETRIQEALSGNRFRGTFTIGSGDSQITDTLSTEPIGVGDNWTVIGTPGATGTFMSTAIQVGDTIIFTNAVEAPATVQVGDFAIKPYVGADIVDGLTADQSSDAFRALSARQGYVLDQAKLDKLASGESNKIILSTGTGIKRSDSEIVTDLVSAINCKQYTVDWGSAPFDVDFDGTTGVILDSITPGSKAIPWEGTIAGRTVMVWTDGEDTFVEIVLQSGDSAANFTVDVSSSPVTVTRPCMPDDILGGGLVNYLIDQKAEELRDSLAADEFAGKIDKTSSGGANEILLADGSGGVAKSGKKIVNEITEPDGESELGNLADIPNGEAVVEYVKSAGFRWIVD